MSLHWPKDLMRELIGLAEANGESRAAVSDTDAAERFRFALYKFRQANGIGEALCITIDGTAVVLTKPAPAPVVILDTAKPLVEE